MPAGPMPKTMSSCSIASRYRRWLTLFGAMRFLPAAVSVPFMKCSRRSTSSSRANISEAVFTSAFDSL